MGMAMRQAQNMRAARVAISVRAVLEWAFGAECASIEFDELGPPVGIDTIWLLAQRGLLGCKVDGGRMGGGAQSADDAEIIAGVVAALPDRHGGRGMAVRVAQLARAGLVPDYMPDATPRIVPLDTRRTKHGVFAVTEVTGHAVIRNRKGALVRSEVKACPVRIYPTAQQIGMARRFYLDWIGALMHIQHELQLVGLSRWDVTGGLPEMTPWTRGRV